MPNCCGVGSCVVLFLETGEGTRNCCGVGSCAGLFLETGVELESSRSRSMILWTSSALEGRGDLDWDCPAGVGSGYAGFTDHSWLQGQRQRPLPPGNQSSLGDEVSRQGAQARADFVNIESE